MLKKILVNLHKHTTKLIESTISLFSVILFSNLNIAIRITRINKTINKSENCIIFGNGPSLKTEIENTSLLKNCKDSDIFVVNLFCKYDLFYTIQPKYYFLADNVFFEPKSEKHKEIFNSLLSELNKVSWSMFLILPASKRQNKLVENIRNDNIRFIYLNTTPTKGYRSLSHLIYRLNLGMPRCQTVINFAIFTALNFKYKTIYLYGVDHSWTKDLFVNDENQVCYGDRHVYNTSLTIVKKEKKIDELLLAFSEMFKTHRELRSYSDHIGSMIYNCTKDSFIDSYNRLKIK